MCAWLRITASRCAGSTGGGCQLRRRSAFRPWKRPQSRRRRVPPASRRCLDPVTVPAAPRNVTEGLIFSSCLNVEDFALRFGLFAPAALSPSRLNVEDSGLRFGLFAPPGLSPSRLNVEDSGLRFGLFTPPGLSPSRLNVEDSGLRFGLFAPPGL